MDHAPLLSEEQRVESHPNRDQRDERNLQLLSELSMQLPRSTAISSMLQISDEANTKVKKSSSFAQSDSPNATHHFPSILFVVLSTPEYETFVTWLPHGRAWKILNYEAFILKILPVFFGMHNCGFRMFERKLSMWGFRAVTHGPDAGAYFHQFFLRDMPRVHLVMRPTEVALSPHRLSSNLDDLIDISARAPESQRYLSSLDYIESNTSMRAEALFRTMVGGPVACDKQLRFFNQTDSFGVRSRNYAWAERFANDFAAAQELHDRTVERLEIAKRVVDHSSSSQTSSETNYPAHISAPCHAKVPNSPKRNKDLQYSVSQPNSPCKQSPPRSPKRTRRKWLPSFGVSPTFNSALLKNIPYLEDTSGDWVYTSPEAFATLSENRALKRQQLPSPKQP